MEAHHHLSLHAFSRIGGKQIGLRLVKDHSLKTLKPISKKPQPMVRVRLLVLASWRAATLWAALADKRLLVLNGYVERTFVRASDFSSVEGNASANIESLVAAKESVAAKRAIKKRCQFNDMLVVG